MEISATVRNSGTDHAAVVRTGGSDLSLPIPAKRCGQGSGVSGGELLMLALATCYCNDLYREASRLGIALHAVEVHASASFPGVGLAATNIRYQAKVSSPAEPAVIAELLRQTDAVAEVHNTLRSAAPVVLVTESTAGP